MNGIQLFDHGWIALRTAPSPSGPWSPERKLFTGSIYNTGDDVIIGPPEVALHLLHADLNGCLVFSEPAMLATPGSLYVALLGAEGTSTNGRIALIRLQHSTAAWEYRGSLLVNAQDGPPF